MTQRLYYDDSFLYDFDAEVKEVVSEGGRQAAILDRTAFYPTSGGQVFDTGTLADPAGGEAGAEVRVDEVSETGDGRILHFLETLARLQPGSRVHGRIDPLRRRDHMQQHSGQHVLSAAFVRLFNFPTVSFHMGKDYCSIDLDAGALKGEQVVAAEQLANEVVQQDRPVGIRYATPEEARSLGVRKLPPEEKDRLRLIDIASFDLTACGGTHVRGTGQIGAILLRKTEKVKQGWRVEFVCGMRAVSRAREEYQSLNEAAALFSAHLREVPQQIRKAQGEIRAGRKAQEALLEEVADLHAARLFAQASPAGGRRIVAQVFTDRDLPFIKLLAQRLVRQGGDVVALLASASGPASLVFGASPGQPFDMGALMKEALAKTGGRGGGSREMAQGGAERPETLEAVLQELAARLRS